jgi:hypothetical protein
MADYILSIVVKRFSRSVNGVKGVSAGREPRVDCRNSKQCIAQSQSPQTKTCREDDQLFMDEFASIRVEHSLPLTTAATIVAR